MPITAHDVRRQAVARSLFAPTTLAKAIGRLGFVQADPIAAPARAQDLILRHRVEGYQAGDLERRYPNLALEEDYIHVYGYVPRGVLGLLHPRPGEWRVEREYPALAGQVLKFVRAQGEADHRDVEKALGNMRTAGGWGGLAKATTRVLDMLHWRGQLRIARREGNLRRYAPAATPQSSLPPAERLRRLALRLVRLYAPVSEATLRDLISRLRYAAPSLDGRRGAIRALVEAGDLEQAQADGVTYTWPRGEWLEQEAPREVRWLAPFDPIVWDRRRFEHLWGWPYRFEAYTPAARRRWGYYAMPMLWRDRIIGWANATAEGKRLEVRQGFVDGRPRGRDFKRALEEERARMEEFLAPNEYHVFIGD